MLHQLKKHQFWARKLFQYRLTSGLNKWHRTCLRGPDGGNSTLAETHLEWATEAREGAIEVENWAAPEEKRATAQQKSITPKLSLHSVSRQRCGPSRTTENSRHTLASYVHLLWNDDCDFGFQGLFLLLLLSFLVRDINTCGLLNTSPEMTLNHPPPSWTLSAWL